MTINSSVEEIRDHLETIPEQKWCKDALTDGKGAACVIGHINRALHNTYKHAFTPKGRVHVRVLFSNLKLSIDVIVRVNNEAKGNPKKDVINYFNKLVNKKN